MSSITLYSKISYNDYEYQIQNYKNILKNRYNTLKYLEINVDKYEQLEKTYDIQHTLKQFNINIKDVKMCIEYVKRNIKHFEKIKEKVENLTKEHIKFRQQIMYYNTMIRKYICVKLKLKIELEVLQNSQIERSKTDKLQTQICNERTSQFLPWFENQEDFIVLCNNSENDDTKLQLMINKIELCILDVNSKIIHYTNLKMQKYIKCNSIELYLKYYIMSDNKSANDTYKEEEEDFYSTINLLGKRKLNLCSKRETKPYI